MSGKNLTFKLVLDGDSKGLVAAAKQSESTVKAVFETIKDEAQKVKSAAADAGTKIGDLVPSETKQKVAQLVTELSSASKTLEEMGSDANLSAENLKQLGVYGEQALQGLQNNLKQAKLHLNYLAATNATPVDIENAQREVKELETGVKQVKIAFEAYSSNAEAASGATDQLGSEASDTAQQINKLDTELEQTNTELAKTETFAQSASKEVQDLKTGFTALTGALAALGIGTSAMEIAQTADEYKNLSSRINIAIGEHGNLQKAMDDVKNTAIATNANLTATGDLYSRLTKIGQEMKWPQEQALALTETINKAIQVGGGSATSNEAAITQLNQALGSGVLRGDEFNSMVEQSPRLTQAMAEGLGITTGKLREMAGEGKLTTDVVTKSLLSQSEKISAEFAKFSLTIGASITNLKTAWTTYIGEADAATGASAKVAEALKFVAENLDTIVSTLMLAGQAFVAYKALNIANTFFDKAVSVRVASVAIAQETTAVVANTQAQIANAAATRGAATAKTQLATNAAVANTSMAASGGSVMTLIGRLGALGVAVTAVGVLFAAAVIPIGTAIGEGIAKLQGYGKALEDLERQTALETARAKVAAEIKAEQAVVAEKARDKTYQLTEESKKLVAEFDELIKKGEPTKEALEKISNAMKFDSTKGINDSVTALILLQEQGKITSEDLQLRLSTALDGKDLLVFETNAKAAFAGTSKEAEKTAALTEAVMKASLERTGLSTEQLQGKFSLTFQSASNDVQMVINNLDAYKAKGIDTGLALSANLNKAVDTAQTRAELDYAKAKLLQLEKQGLITGEQVALGLGLIEKKAQQLPEALNPTIAAFNALGIKTKEQLNEAAESAKRNFDVVSKSGQATAEGIKQAYETMLNAAIASGDKARIATAQAKAASQGLTVEISETGKAAVKSMDEWAESNDRVRNSAERIGDGYRHAGNIAREEAKSSTEAWSDAVKATSAQFDAEMKRQSKGLSDGIYNYDAYSRSDVISQVKSMGYDDAEAEKLAATIWSKGLAADRDAKASNMGKGGNAGLNYLIQQEFDNAAAKGQTTQNGTNKINDLLSQLAGNSASAVVKTPAVSVPDAGKTIQNNITINGKTISVPVAEANQGSFNDFLSELETLKNRM